jgi:hypothetical protein
MSEENINCILVRTDKGEYSGNETIYGSVYLKITEVMANSQRVTLTLRGFEKCQFQVAETLGEDVGNGGASQKKYRYSTKEILNVKHTLLDSPGGFPVGHYAYPFQIALPEELPGVFYYKNDRGGKVLQEALVQYVCCASLEREDAHVLLQNELPIVVYNGTLGNPVSRSAVQTVKSFFCINRGDVYLELRIKQVDFGTGKEAPVHITIKNESSVEIRSVSIKLIRVIKLISNNDLIRLNMLRGFTQSTNMTASNTVSTTTDVLSAEEGLELRRDFTLIDNIYDSYCEGCQSQRIEERVVNIPLTHRDDPLPPTTAGEIVKVCTLSCIIVHVHTLWLYRTTGNIGGHFIILADFWSEVYPNVTSAKYL